MLGSVLDPVLRPLLSLPPLAAIALVSFIITLLSTVVYKYTTDQKRIKELRAEQKKHQARMKEHRDDPKKVMAIQKEMMAQTGELFRHSMRPMLYTLLPLIILFSWFAGNLVYMGLAPGEPFTVQATLRAGEERASLDIIPEGVDFLDPAEQEAVEGVVTWRLRGEAGTYKAVVTTEAGESEHRFLLSEEWRYLDPVGRPSGDAPAILVGNERVRPFGDFSFLGWRPGWLGAYILLSVLFNLGLRKLLGVV